MAPSSTRSRIRTLVAVAALTTGPSACLCGPTPAEVSDARLDSPRATVEAFQVFVRAELYDREYRCFSQDFVRRNALSLAVYSEFRDRQPWLKWFAKGDVIDEQAGREGEHRIDLRVAGRTLRVRLVREDFWRISREDEVLADGRGRFSELVRPSDAGSGTGGVSVQLPTRDPSFDLSSATAVTVERVWKIDDVFELQP